MFEKNNLTDFEKLLYANKYIEELKKEIKSINIENGILKSEIDELKYLLKKEVPETNKLRNYKIEMRNLRLKCNKFKRDYEKCNQELLNLKLRLNEKTIL